MDAPGTQSAELTWRAGATPVSARFEDPYFSLTDGLAEARHVFLAGNGLPARFSAGFVVAELGFGTGLNALAAAAAWRGTGALGRLRFVSFEAFPMRAADMARALASWPELAGDAASLVAAWAAGARRIALPGLDLEVIEGDARATLPRWDGRADAWFLDGFSPARNPELWSPELLGSVAAHTRPGGSCATYSAAGAVRRALAAAGFVVTRRPGFGRKRHMTTGRLGA
jgi:tRNA U34 5-methylaminomethyl-2-thiouridine-forming methyltransferase MnmC